MVVGAHVAHRQAGLDLAGHARLLQADHALLTLADAEQQDRGGLRARHRIGLDRQLVARDQRHAAPGDEGGAEQVEQPPAARRAGSPHGRRRRWREDGRRRRPASSTPASAARRGRPGSAARAGRDALAAGHLVQQAELRVVEQLPLLALLHGIDREADLLAELVDLVGIKIGDAGMGVEDRLDRREVILARIDLVIDEGGRQARLTGMDGQELDALLAMGVWCGPSAVTLFLVLADARTIASSPIAAGSRVSRVTDERAFTAGSGAGLADEGVVAEIIAAGREALAQAALVGARQGQLDGAVGDDHEAAALGALLGDHITGLVMALGELAGQGGELASPRRLNSGTARSEPGRIVRPLSSLTISTRPGLASTTARRFTR